jgi:hypothetical protein
MTSNYLLDEHLPTWWAKTIVQLQAGLTVWRVGVPGAPPLQSPDPVLLDWCEIHDFILVTQNRASMPGHLADHVAAGRHIPGILHLSPAMTIHEVAEELALIAGAGLPSEFQDQIRYLPIQ